MSFRRLERTRRLFEGRHAFVAIASFAGLFLTLGILVRYSFLQRFDLHVTQELQERNLPVVLEFMRAATWIGSPAVVPFLTLVAAFFVWRQGLPRAATLVLLSLLSIPLDALLKEIWQRARPDSALVHVAVKTAGTSFPSGHAMTATAFFGALAALAWIHIDLRHGRLAATIGAAAIPLIVDVSRVYLGAHWLSDVVGGSAASLLLLVVLVRWYLRGIPEETEGQEAAAAQAQAGTV